MNPFSAHATLAGSDAKLLLKCRCETAEMGIADPICYFCNGHFISTHTTPNPQLHTGKHFDVLLNATADRVGHLVNMHKGFMR